MRTEVELIIVIPVGPGCRPDFVADTIRSVETFVHSDYRIILADDSQKGTGAVMAGQFKFCEVVLTNKSMGKLGGLYITLSHVFQYALDHYQFEVLLRMDTDALIIGHNPDTEARQLFRKQPLVGIAGQYPFDYNGEPWDISWPRGQIRRLIQTRQFFKSPLANLKLAVLYMKAISYGYTRGESVFGGACFYNPRLLEKLSLQKLLPRQILGKVDLEEDHLFSLLCKATGFELGSLSGPGLPMGCAWRGLPASPQQLLNDGKKVIHSTRFFETMDEQAIREYYSQKRAEASTLAQATL